MPPMKGKVVSSRGHGSEYARSLRPSQRELVKTNYIRTYNQSLLSDVLLIRNCLLHVHYYSKPNSAQLVCVKQEFVLSVSYNKLLLYVVP